MAASARWYASSAGTAFPEADPVRRTGLSAPLCRSATDGRQDSVVMMLPPRQFAENTRGRCAVACGTSGRGWRSGLVSAADLGVAPIA